LVSWLAFARSGGLVLFVVVATSACATIMGGLDEGTQRRVGGVEAGAPAVDASQAPLAWLAGFRYRVPIRVEHPGVEVDADQVALDFATSSLIASGKMRVDGADVRVTKADGVTEVPHWIDTGLGTDHTLVWARLDLQGAATDAWLYYGNAGATSTSSIAETFVPAILDDPMFDREDTWTRNNELDHPLRATDQVTVTRGGGRATIWFATNPTPNGASVRLCEPVVVPAGSGYRIVFDLDVTFVDGSAKALATLGDDGFWPSPPATAVGHHHAVETRRLSALALPLCFEVFLVGTTGNAMQATVSSLRVRRDVNGVGDLRLSGPEQTGP
jgi:hypothetical protein